VTTETENERREALPASPSQKMTQRVRDDECYADHEAALKC
jgi:hypothetical protein